MSYCKTCSELIDTESRGCENPRCIECKAIAISKARHIINKEITANEGLLTSDDIVGRAIRRGAIEGMKRARDIIEGSE